MPRFIAAFLIVCGLAFLQTANAAVPKNALGAIAVSPDGKTVLAAGDNRVLYVLDADSLKVTKAIWIGINPLSIHFSSDGSGFVLHDTKNTLTFYSTENWKKKAVVKNANSIAVAEKANIIFASAYPKGRGENATTKVMGYDLKTRDIAFEATVNTGVHALGTLSDASQLYVLSREYKTQDEKKEKPAAGLKGREKEIFKLKHDGRMAQFLTLDEAGNETGRFASWFSTTSTVQIVADGDIVRAVGYSNRNAVFDPAGKMVGFFKTKNSYNYGIGHSAVHNRLATGGLANGTITDLKSGEGMTFKISRIGGWPEYFKGFAVASDGTVYGGTSAYRLIKIGPDGKVLAETPVY